MDCRQAFHRSRNLACDVASWSEELRVALKRGPCLSDGESIQWFWTNAISDGNGGGTALCNYEVDIPCGWYEGHRPEKTLAAELCGWRSGEDKLASPDWKALKIDCPGTKIKPSLFLARKRKFRI